MKKFFLAVMILFWVIVIPLIVYGSWTTYLSQNKDVSANNTVVVVDDTSEVSPPPPPMEDFAAQTATTTTTATATSSVMSAIVLSNFSADVYPEKIEFAWEFVDPNNELDAVYLIRTTGSQPKQIADGEVLYAGTDQHYIVQSIEQNIRYLYGLFAVSQMSDQVIGPLYPSVAVAQVTPPPLPLLPARIQSDGEMYVWYVVEQGRVVAPAATGNNSMIKESPIVPVTEDTVDALPLHFAVVAEGSAEVYLLSKAGTKRLVRDDAILASYQLDRDQVVTVPAQLLALYPETTAVRLPYTQDIYLVSSQGKQRIENPKKYLTQIGYPIVDIVVISQAEFDSYPVLPAIE